MTVNNKEVFVVTMYRCGDHEKHSYVLGVWSKERSAIKYGKTEELWRADKYKSEVTKWNIDACECDIFRN
jgi:hypothetical protein